MRLTSYLKVWSLVLLVLAINIGAVRRRVEVQMSGPQIEGLGMQYAMNPTLSALVVGSLLSEHPALAAGLMGMYQTQAPNIRLPVPGPPQSPILPGKTYAPAYSSNAVPVPKYVPPNFKPYYTGPPVAFDVEERPRR
ncbi:uncharacterized protein [Bemisia tabaci]